MTTDNDVELFPLTVAVPMRTCSICGARVPVIVREAVDLRQLGRMDSGADLIVRGWTEPKDWRSIDLPTGERVQACATCGPEFSREVDTVIESMKARRRNAL